MLNNLQKRVFTALLIYPCVVLIILYSNDVIIRLFLNILIFLASFEISKMCFYNTELENGKESTTILLPQYLSRYLFRIY